MIFKLASCVLLTIFVTAQAQKQSTAMYRVIENKTAVSDDHNPFLNETVHSTMQCFMKRIDHPHFVEVKTDGKMHQCRFYEAIKPSSIRRSPEAGIVLYQYLGVTASLCQDLDSEVNGVFQLTLGSEEGSLTKVYCDQTENGGGWTTFQRRIDGSVDFIRNWEDYKNGFGEADGNYWLGLEKLHQITHRYETVLIRVEATTNDGSHTFVIHEGFKVSPESDFYRLTAGILTEGDYSYGRGWNVVNNYRFTTYDKDNDNYLGGNCAILAKGGGWFKSCAWIDFNSPYSQIRWFHFSNDIKSISLAVKVKN
ncbi:microfibril-associated glycoprotein 4-like [Clytia hemisphaerica]|uniref:Fibrinogen C-terminal domain-containing protein n=1 Tax=Clytia hemisphaerica TaxID=252671 RepID=A0A7M6DRS2_9CNID